MGIIAVEKPIIVPFCDRMPDWDGKTWLLVESWTIIFQNKRVYWRLTVKPEFTTDGGSIPRLARRLWTPIGPYLVAYIVHDYLYAAELVDRSEADYILLELLESLGACWVDRNAQYAGVRAGGRAVWLEHNKEEVQELKEAVIWEYRKC